MTEINPPQEADPSIGGARAPLTAVTVTYNSGDVLDDFLVCVAAQQGAWHLIIVDNASSDGTRERLKRIDDDRITVVFNDRNTGFAAGSNVGIRLALGRGAPSILLLNNDTVFGTSLFGDLERAFVAAGVDAMSPVIVFDHDPNTIWYAGGRIDWLRGVKVIHDHFEREAATAGAALFKTEFCPACCMIFKPTVFEKIGLLDEDFFVYCEDVEFCERMRGAGMTIAVTPDIRLRHKASFLTGGMESDFSVFEQHKNRIIFLRKTRKPLYVSYSVVKIAGIALRRSALKPGGGKAIALKFKALWTGATTDIARRPG